MRIRFDVEYSDPDFIWYILKLIETMVKREFNPDKVEQIEEYIDTNQVFGDVEVDCSDIILNSPKHLVVYTTNRSVNIEFDEDELFWDTDVRYTSVLNFITFGNLEVRGYPLIFEVFKSISENVKFCYKCFKEGYSVNINL